jgi:hypothetical protein
VNGRLEVLLTIAATAVAIAFFASVPHWPKEPLNNPIPSFVSAAAEKVTSTKAPLLGPSLLASLRPAPDLNLGLPADIAVVTARRGINGETGLIRTLASITTFRILGTTDLVSVAMIEGADPIRATAAQPDSAIRIRGQYAVASTDRGITHIRWTENGVTFDIASRTLDPARLAEVANKLR